MPDRTVRDMLLARVDELVASIASLLDEVRAVTEQLEPERARSCRNDLVRHPKDGRVMSLRGFIGPASP
jgi:hypothetical protein